MVQGMFSSEVIFILTVACVSFGLGMWPGRHRRPPATAVAARRCAPNDSSDDAHPLLTPFLRPDGDDPAEGTIPKCALCGETAPHPHSIEEIGAWRGDHGLVTRDTAESRLERARMEVSLAESLAATEIERARAKLRDAEISLGYMAENGPTRAASCPD